MKMGTDHKSPCLHTVQQCLFAVYNLSAHGGKSICTLGTTCLHIVYGLSCTLRTCRLRMLPGDLLGGKPKVSGPAITIPPSLCLSGTEFCRPPGHTSHTHCGHQQVTSNMHAPAHVWAT